MMVVSSWKNKYDRDAPCSSEALKQIVKLFSEDWIPIRQGPLVFRYLGITYTALGPQTAAAVLGEAPDDKVI